jgi:hypothetical protein
MKLESLIPKLIDSAQSGVYIPLVKVKRKILINEDAVKVYCEYDGRLKDLNLLRFDGKSCREVLRAVSVDKKNRRDYPLVINTKNGSYAIIDYNQDRVLEIVEKARKNGTLKLR